MHLKKVNRFEDFKSHGDITEFMISNVESTAIIANI